MKKILFTLIITIIIICGFCNFAYAVGFDRDTSIVEYGKDWLSSAETDSKGLGIGQTDYWSDIAGVLTGIGIWVILITGSILGIRFMVVKAEQKAEVKKQLIIWLIGTVIVLGALTIWKVSVQLVDIL